MSGAPCTQSEYVAAIKWHWQRFYIWEPPLTEKEIEQEYNNNSAIVTATEKIKRARDIERGHIHWDKGIVR